MGCAMVFSLMTSCGRQPARQQEQAVAAPPFQTVRVVPSELFAGDLKPLAPHLQMNGGRALLQFEDREIWVKSEVDLWENGKHKQLTSSESRLKGPGEVSISLKEETSSEGKWKLRIVRATSGESGGGSGAWWIDLPQKGKKGLLAVTQNVPKASTCPKRRP
jgi:hypothetical protein